MSMIDPFTGFGDDTNSSVKFQMQSDRGRVPNWTSTAQLKQFMIPNSDRTITQRLGRDPWVMTCKLLFASIDDLELFDVLQGQRSTLRYVAHITSRAGGTVETLLSTQYLRLPETLLKDAKTEATYRSGQFTVAATFERAYSGGDTYGFARFAEDVN